LSYAEKFENTLYFLIPKEKVEEIRDKDGEKADRGEPGARSVTSFFSSSFYGAFQRRLVPPRLRRRAPPEGCRHGLCRGRKKRKKRLIRLQVHP
jgi:hypothetical protein